MAYDCPAHISASPEHADLKLLEINKKKFTEPTTIKSKARVWDFRQ